MTVVELKHVVSSLASVLYPSSAVPLLLEDSPFTIYPENNPVLLVVSAPWYFGILYGSGRSRDLGFSLETFSLSLLSVTCLLLPSEIGPSYC